MVCETKRSPLIEPFAHPEALEKRRTGVLLGGTGGKKLPRTPTA
jgi:hypothetical protein